MGIAALIVAGGVLMSRILGVLRDVIFAAMLGATGVTDEYVAAFTIPDFMNYLLAGGFLSITFIPIFSRYLADDDEEGGWKALTAVIRPLAVAIVALVAVGWVLAPTVIDALFPDFTTEQLESTVRLTRIVLPAQIFFVLGALLTAVQYAKGQFLIPTLAPIIYNLAIISGGVFYAAFTGEADPEGFIWGALVGAFVGNFLLQWWGARRVGMHLVWRLPWRNPVILEYLKIAFPLMIGQSVVVLDETFMRMFGNMTGEGVQTQLQYARRTMLVPVGVIAQAAGVAAYPFLARQFAEGKLSQMADTVDRALKWVLALSIGATALLVALSVPTIRVLFERFEFTSADTTATASALFFYAFAIPTWGALTVITRAFYARRQMWTPVIVGTAASVLAVPLYFTLQREFGIEGVALASTLALGAYTATLTILWYREPDHSRRWRPVLDAAARAIPLAVLGGAAAYLVSAGFAAVLPDGFLSALLVLLVGTAAFAAVALGTGSLLARRFAPS
jgi:putative peptidoglycan lipid II flippase